MQTLTTKPPLNLVRHVDIRDFGLGVSKERLILIWSIVEVVIIKPDSGLSMTRGRERDDSRVEGRSRRSEECVLETVEKRKVAEVVYAEVLLKTVLGLGFGVASYSFPRC
jgi:hypothetical protein